MTFQSNNMDYSQSINKRESNTSSGETTDFDTDRPGSFSLNKKLTIQNTGSSSNDDKFLSIPQVQSNLVFLPTSPEGLRTDDDKRRYQFERSRSSMSDNEYENSFRNDPDRLRSIDTNIDSLIFEPIETLDEHESSCREEDIICLPPMAIFSHFHRPRQRTLTSHSDFNDSEHKINEHQEGHASWGDVPNKNDEIERDELVLYIQRNSRMLFAGILAKNLLTEEYLQNLWLLMLTEMADLDREIQTIPICKETNKYSADLKFQFNENSRQTQYERIAVGNRYYYKTPKSDNACMAFNARTKLHINPERRMIGLSRGNNSIAINRTLPDRITYYCHRFQEST
ncbi:hypothetical protein I4U23_007448 [Adineta vaga]|nr:hypothetical protein I4U23_007448 [Adineta vaga]